MKLKTQREWQAYCAGKYDHLPPKPDEVPSNPGKHYVRKGWDGYPDWLDQINLKHTD